ncbi:MAG: DUF4292 domain-containing protein [Myxococcota bacterium]|nr:DUF4292 domain-containing protein [Myxococcota bacterium]
MTIFKGVIALLFLFSAACAGSTQFKKINLEQLQTRLLGQFDERQSVSADTVLRLETPQGKLQQHGSMVISRDGQMRLDIRGPHGGVLLVLVIDGAKLYFLDLQAGRYVESATDNQQVAEVFPFLPPLSLGRQWGDMLLGNIEPGEGAKLQTPDSGEHVLVWEQMTLVSKMVKSKTGLDVWSQKNALLEHRLRVNAQNGKVLGYTIFSKSDQLLKIDYEKWRSDGFIEQMKIVLPQRETVLELSFRDVQKNLDFSPNIFKLKVPKGVRKEIW